MTIDYFVPVVGQEEMAYECTRLLTENALEFMTGKTKIYIVDNGSKQSFIVSSIRNEENLGMVATLKQCMDNSEAEILVYAHSDFMVHHKGWDLLLKSHFVMDEKLGMVVSMGCQQADANGGRSRCFCSFVFDGVVHGKAPSKEGNFVAMADGCFLAMRRSIMDVCGIPDLRFPVHHFYERDWILEMVTSGYRAKVIPLDADHLSGQTACQPECQEWFNQRGGEQSIYNEAERMYLAKWGHLLPVHCDDAGNYFTKAGPVFNSENA